MRALLPLWRHWRLFILRWAMREIDPLHPDVPAILIEISYWESSHA